MIQSRPRKPRFKRVSDAALLIITERDFRILLAVGCYRLVQSHHLLKLIGGSRQHMVRRLGRLFHAGFLERPLAQLYIRDKIGPAFAYCLTSQGQKIVFERSPNSIPSIPRQRATVMALSLAHSLRVTDVLAAMETVALTRQLVFCRPQEWPSTQSLQDRTTGRLRWPISLKPGAGLSKAWLIPDGAFSFQSPDGEARYFILEVDRGTMPVVRRKLFQSSFHRKILSYKETRRQGVLWNKFQVPAFRVLIVTESRRRLFSLQQATASTFKRGESEMCLFAVASELLVQTDPLDHEWETCSGKKAAIVPTLLAR